MRRRDFVILIAVALELAGAKAVMAEDSLKKGIAVWKFSVCKDTKRTRPGDDYVELRRYTKEITERFETAFSRVEDRTRYRLLMRRNLDDLVSQVRIDREIRGHADIPDETLAQFDLRGVDAIVFGSVCPLDKSGYIVIRVSIVGLDGRLYKKEETRFISGKLLDVDAVSKIVDNLSNRLFLEKKKFQFPYRPVFWGSFALTAISGVTAVVSYSKIDDYEMAARVAAMEAGFLGDPCEQAVANQAEDIIEICNNGRDAATISTIAQGVFVVGAVASAFLLYKGYIAKRPKKNRRRPRISITPSLSRREGGVKMIFSF